MLNRQYVIQTLVSMAVHVKRMERGTIVFVMFNTQDHSAKVRIIFKNDVMSDKMVVFRQ